LEQRHVLSIVRLAIPTSDAIITASKQHATSTDTKLGKHVTDSGCGVLWDGLFMLSIRGSEGLGNRRFTKNGVEPLEVRLVTVDC